MRKSSIVLFTFLVVFTLAACKSEPKLQPTAQGEARASAEATQEPIQIALATDPQKPQVDKPFTLRVHLSKQGGAAIPDATVQGELSMKTMDHGKQQLEFASKGNGDYQAIAKAVMSGAWLVKVTARAENMPVTKEFDVEVGE